MDEELTYVHGFTANLGMETSLFSFVGGGERKGVWGPFKSGPRSQRILGGPRCILQGRIQDFWKGGHGPMGAI